MYTWDVVNEAFADDGTWRKTIWYNALVRAVIPYPKVILLTRPLADTGAQPLVSDDGKIILAVNGEIYNHTKLRESLKNPYAFKTHSDCEVIIPLVSVFSKSYCRAYT